MNKKGQMWKYIVGFIIAVVLLLILMFMLSGTTGKTRSIIEKLSEFLG